MKPSRYSRRRNSVVRWYRSASARVNLTSGCRGRRGGRFRSSTTLERRVRIITSCVSARSASGSRGVRSEEHTSELQSQSNLVCRLLLEKKKKKEQSSSPLRQARHSTSSRVLTVD